MAVRATGGLRLARSGRNYLPFCLDATAVDEPANIDITVVADPQPAAPALPVLFHTGSAWSLHGDQEQRAICMSPSANSACPLWVAHGDLSFSKLRLHCSNDLVSRAGPAPVLNRVAWESPLSQLLVVEQLYRHGGLLLHASGLALEGRGLVFCGVSGAGKTTLARMLLGDGLSTVLSDDRVIVRHDGHGFAAYGTPWTGEAEVAVNQAAPLAALCFLSHGSTTALKTLSKAAALERLLPVASILWYQASAVEEQLSVCQHLLDTTPAYELQFTTDSSALCHLLREFQLAA